MDLKNHKWSVGSLGIVIAVLSLLLAGPQLWVDYQQLQIALRNSESIGSADIATQYEVVPPVATSIQTTQTDEPIKPTDTPAIQTDTPIKEEFEMDTPENVKRLLQKQASNENRYIDDHLKINSPDLTEIAVYVLKEGKEELATTSILEERFKNDGSKIVSGLFRPNFINEGHLKTLSDGHASILKHNQISRHVDYLVVGNYSSSVTASTLDHTKKSASVQLTVVVFDSEGRIVKKLEHSKTGIGPSENAAINEAFKRTVNTLTLTL